MSSRHGQRQPRGVPQGVRDELDQSMRWWDREFATLLRLAFTERPYIAAEHEGHDRIEEHYIGGRVETYCTECPSVWEPNPTRPATNDVRGHP